MGIECILQFDTLSQDCSNPAMIVASFVVFLLVFVLIGAASTLKSKKNNADYLLAGRSVSPILVGLSAMATNNSGYMFIGAIGYTYASGLESIWVMFAWMLGDFMASFFIHKKLRVISEKQHSLSFGEMIATWNNQNHIWVKKLVGIITIVFLGAYAAAQFTAGSKALHVIFGWDYSVGAIIGSLIVLIYCLAGGIRASIWTDAAQTIVMFLAMGLMLYMGIGQAGGLAPYFGKLQNVSETYLNLFPQSLHSNPGRIALYLLGWIMGGIGIIAQPHVMIRFMALDDPKHMVQARSYYYLFYFLFCAVTFGVGLSARLYYPDTTVFDAELALPKMTMALLPEVLIGLVLAGIFSASMSTADSQILSCSAALTNDVYDKKRESVLFTKGATGFVTLLALGISLSGNKSVFKLVLVSWSVLASAFAPLLIIYAFKGILSQRGALGVMLVSVATSLIWRSLELGKYIYEAAPGMLAGLLFFVIFLRSSRTKNVVSMG